MVKIRLARAGFLVSRRPAYRAGACGRLAPVAASWLPAAGAARRGLYQVAAGRCHSACQGVRRRRRGVAGIARAPHRRARLVSRSSRFDRRAHDVCRRHDGATAREVRRGRREQGGGRAPLHGRVRRRQRRRVGTAEGDATTGATGCSRGKRTLSPDHRPSSPPFHEHHQRVPGQPRLRRRHGRRRGRCGAGRFWRGAGD